MLRRDYILVAIEEFAEVLARILGFTKEQQWQAAAATAGQECERLVGVDLEKAVQMTDAELFARLIEGEATHMADTKVFMLATLFKTTGDARAGERRVEESRQYYLKAMDLLLDALDRTALDQRPDFAPTIETLFVGLGDAPLPAKTHALLMRHYERMGEFGKAEDALFAIAELEPPGEELLKFGTDFYDRLSKHSDAALADGNLTRAEAEAGLAEFRARMKP